MARRKDCIILLILSTLCAAAIYDRPHIIFILADDLVSIAVNGTKVGRLLRESRSFEKCIQSFHRKTEETIWNTYA
jgi:hypothetical protein